MKKISLVFGMLFLFAGMAFAQRTVSGTVSDAEGNPLIGATVLVQGTSTGTVSDIDGAYSISVPEGGEVLVFSYTGYATLEVALGSSNVMDVVLEESAAQLSEVVVVGYGTQIKSTLTGNIAKVAGEELENLPVPSVEQAMQGRSAGVFVEAVNGKPGGAIRVRIRGASSISASNQPLYVIDGIPITVESQNASGAPLNPLADLNFNDIESIDILKDASASAIYGSRAANGVVLITTKKGKAGTSKIDFNYQVGTSRPTGYREFLNTAEYIELFTEAAQNLDEIEGNVPGGFTWKEWVEGRFNRYSGPSDWKTQETDTDWQELAFADNPISQQANLNFSGGNNTTTFYAGLGFSDQQGILKGNGFERMSARLNLDHKATDKLTVGLNFSLARTFTDQVSNDNAFSTPLQLIALAPITPDRNYTNEPFLSGSRLIQPGELFDRPVATYYNGLIELEESQRNVVSYRTLANGYARWQLAPGLVLNGEMAADIYNLRDDLFQGSITFGGQASNGYAYSRATQVLNYNTKLFANYAKTFGSHNLDFTLGTEYQDSRNQSTDSEGQQFPVDDLKTISSAADITGGSSFLTEFTFVSYFTRVNYNFNRKYLLSFSGRVDGSSRFGTNNRYGFFPAASLGWVLSEEGFLKDNSTLSFLKLRASYGLIGNAAIGNFEHLGLFGAEGYNGVSGLQPSQIPNPDLTWENTAQVDIGLDFGFLKDRINGEIDYYQKVTSDLLLGVPVPATSGFTIQTQNIGEVVNKGLEFVLNTNNTVGAFKWNTSFNMAYNINEVTKLADGQDLIDPGSSRLMNVVKLGQPIGVFWGAEYAGVDPDNGDPLWYVNKEGSGRETTSNYSDAEFVALGNPSPEWIGGVTNTFDWKGFNLSIQFQGVFGNMIHNSAGSFMSANGDWFDNQTRDQLDRWQKPGDITNVPRAIFLGGHGTQSRSSRYLSDGSYVRLKNVTFGYEFPKKVLDNIGVRRLRLYVVGQNLLTFTNYDGWDPEVTTDAFVNNTTFGVDFYAAPQPKTVAFGINVGF